MWHAPTPIFTTHLLGLPSGRAGAYETARRMRALVKESVRDPAILNAAASILYLQPQHDQRAEVESIFNFVRGSIRYMRDVVGVETLATPQMTMARRVGDCDDQTTLLCTLCEAAGYPTRFVMEGYQTKDFEHIYCQILVNNEWVSADPTMFENLGWEPGNYLSRWVEKV